MDVTSAVSTNQGNPVKLEFADISNETYRTYTFPTGSVTIQNPVKLNVKRKAEGDSHRIVDVNGKAYYVPAGWLMLSWEGKNGEAYSF
jgi:uncharacterized protein YegJ (DUF2314 family)